MARETQWIWPYGAPRWAWMPLAAGAVALYLRVALRLAEHGAGRSLRLWGYGGAAVLSLVLLELEGPALLLLFTRSVSPIT